MSIIRPLEDEIRKFAYELFKRRGGEHGWDVADWLLAERAVTFHKNYERLNLYRFDNEQKIWIGSGEPQICRFCGRQSPEVSFLEEAHAVPAFLGNRTVFILDECDQCNGFFGRFVEDHFAKLLAGARTLMTIHGRDGVPSYKTNDKLTRIDYRSGAMTAKLGPGDPIVDIDMTKRLATFQLETQSHIPLAVYKCFAKIAISVLPKDELRHFAKTLRWILDSHHARQAAHFGNAFVNVWVSPGKFPARYGWVEVFRRKYDSLTIPYIVLIVVVMNFTFQIYVPLCDRDQHLVGQKCTLPFFPGGIHVIGFACGETLLWRLPLGSAAQASIPFEAKVTMVGAVRRSG